MPARLDPNNPFDKAAINHTSVKVKSRNAPDGKIVFTKLKSGELQFNFMNCSVGYSPEQRQDYVEMVRVLQAEGKLGETGFITIKQLESA